MKITWLGTPRARLGITLDVCPPGTGLWFDPVQNKCVQKCSPGQDWDPVKGECVVPAPASLNLQPASSKVCPEGWAWSATHGECLPPQDAVWPQAKCPPGYKFDNKVLYCVPVAAPPPPATAGSGDKTPAGLIVAGLVLVALLVAS